MMLPVPASAVDGAGRLIIMCGLPGSGKTTLARQLEDDDGGVRLCPDEWMRALDVDLFDRGMRRRIEHLQWDVAHRLLQLGQVVVIEWGTWDRGERDRLREGARSIGAAVELRLLDASIDVLWDRVRARDSGRVLGRRPLTRDDMEAYAAMFERPDERELALYDAPRR